MSTNYYWIYEEPAAIEVELPTGERIVSRPVEFTDFSFHIGKRHGVKDGNTVFVFAVEPKRVLDAIENKMHSRPGEYIVRDDYGREFTAKMFSILLHDNAAWELHAIGTEFC